MKSFLEKLSLLKLALAVMAIGIAATNYSQSNNAPTKIEIANADCSKCYAALNTSCRCQTLDGIEHEIFNHAYGQ